MANSISYGEPIYIKAYIKQKGQSLILNANGNLESLYFNNEPLNFRANAFCIYPTLQSIHIGHLYNDQVDSFLRLKDRMTMFDREKLANAGQFTQFMGKPVNFEESIILLHIKSQLCIVIADIDIPLLLGPYGRFQSDFQLSSPIKSGGILFAKEKVMIYYKSKDVMKRKLYIEYSEQLNMPILSDFSIVSMSIEKYNVTSIPNFVDISEKAYFWIIHRPTNSYLFTQKSKINKDPFKKDIPLSYTLAISEQKEHSFRDYSGLWVLEKSHEKQKYIIKNSMYEMLLEMERL